MTSMTDEKMGVQIMTKTERAESIAAAVDAAMNAAIAEAHSS